MDSAKPPKTRDGVESTVINLVDFPMPFMDEPISPKYNPDCKPSAAVQKRERRHGDAYFWVTEYKSTRACCFEERN